MRKFVLDCLNFYYKYGIVIADRNEIKADVCVTSIPQLMLRARRWMLMVEFLLFLIIGLMLSITINIALLCIIYIMWTDKQI